MLLHMLQDIWYDISLSFSLSLHLPLSHRAICAITTRTASINRQSGAHINAAQQDNHESRPGFSIMNNIIKLTNAINNWRSYNNGRRGSAGRCYGNARGRSCSPPQKELSSEHRMMHAELFFHQENRSPQFTPLGALWSKHFLNGEGRYWMYTNNMNLAFHYVMYMCYVRGHSFMEFSFIVVFVDVSSSRPSCLA